MQAKMRIAAAAALVGSAPPALAESGSRSDHSGILIWTFLGFCALIVVAQLIPVLGNLWSTRKAAVPEKNRVKSPVKD